ncbi:hypothetical protein BDR07DRAFT_1411763 [Suillus spraguei]|nr:hypothetical protein BDR07DRAFT_1411763 [Suillus spraguei]
MEEWSRKELKLDRTQRDAWCEFSRFEDAGMLLETTTERTTYIVFWRGMRYISVAVLKINKYHVGKKNVRFYFYSAPLSMSCPVLKLEASSLSPTTLLESTTSSEVYLQNY